MKDHLRHRSIKPHWRRHAERPQKLMVRSMRCEDMNCVVVTSCYMGGQRHEPVFTCNSMSGSPLFWTHNVVSSNSIVRRFTVATCAWGRWIDNALQLQNKARENTLRVPGLSILSSPAKHREDEYTRDHHLVCFLVRFRSTLREKHR